MKKNFDVHSLSDSEVIALANVLRKAAECAYCSNGSHSEHELLVAFVKQADALVAARKQLREERSR